MPMPYPADAVLAPPVFIFLEDRFSEGQITIRPYTNPIRRCKTSAEEDMFFSAESVHWACNHDLDDPRHFSEVCERMLEGNLLAKDHPELIRVWLKDLPPAEEQTKIVNRLNEIAREAACRLTELCWWDIIPHDRILLAKLVPPHPGKTVEIMFLWRRTDKSLNPSMYFTPSPTVYCDFSPVRVNFEAPTYQEVKAQFKIWLAKLPDWVTEEKPSKTKGA